MAGLRFTAAALIIAFVMALLRVPFNVTMPQLKNACIAGFFFLALGNGGVSWALQYVDSGYTALLIAAQPLVLILMMWINNRKPLPLPSWIGVVLGLVGVYLLVSQNELIQTQNQWIGMAIIFMCLVGWGFASIFVSKADMPKPFVNTCIQMLTGGLILIVSSYFLDQKSFSPSEVDLQTWLRFGYLVIFGSVIAFTAFNYLLTSDVSPEKVSTSTYVNPVIALLLGWHFRDELITYQSVIAALILLTGVYFINTNKFKKANS